MTADDILAVIVSYNGRQKTAQTVGALRGRVEHIHIVDNGSDAESLAILDDLAALPGVTVERLGRNRGVAYALNRGVERAREDGAGWLLTMDQDSIATEGMLETYRAAIAATPAMVCLSPDTGRNRRNRPAIHTVGSAITSGNLVKVCLFDEVGLYDETLFIDGVDFDFSLRLRKAEHEIHCLSNAVLQHQLGEDREIPSPLRRYYTEHSPLRRYYMTRNALYLAERYVGRFPLFIVKLACVHLIEAVLLGFYDPNPLRSYGAMVHGARDYVARRTGPAPDSRGGG